MALHSEYDGLNLHMPHIVQEADPGAVGEHKTWLQASTGLLRRRTAADDGWDVIARDPTVNTEIAATYTISIADWGAHVRLSDPSGVILTVPEDATDDLPIGTTVVIEQADDGPVTVEPETSQPVVHSRDGFTTTLGAGSVATIRKVAADEWVLWGDLGS